MTLPCGLNTSEWHLEYRNIGLSLDVILKLMCGLVRPRTLAGPGNVSTVEELVSNDPEKSTTTTTKTLKNSTECVHWDIHQDLCEGSSRRKGQRVDTAAWKQRKKWDSSSRVFPRQRSLTWGQGEREERPLRQGFRKGSLRHTNAWKEGSHGERNRLNKKAGEGGPASSQWD